MSANSDLHAELITIINSRTQPFKHVSNLLTPTQIYAADRQSPVQLDGKYILMIIDDLGPLVMRLWSALICDDGSILLFGKSLSGKTHAAIGDTIIYTVSTLDVDNIQMYEMYPHD